MEFEPFNGRVQSEPNVMVDSSRTPTTVLELSHWPGNATPEAFKADTSAEIVLKAIQAEAPELQWCPFVSNDHYDIDGLLALWAVLNPEAAVATWELLSETADTGDFDRVASTRSLLSCLALQHLEDLLSEDIRAATGDEFTAELYRRMLVEVPRCLEQPDVFRASYQDTLDEIEASLDAIGSSAVSVTEDADLDLLILTSTEPLNEVAVNTVSNRTRVITSAGGVHTFRYKYESFVELVSRDRPPRVRLDKLVERLNSTDTASGTWFFDGVEVAHPRLQLVAGVRIGNQSELATEQFVEEVVSHLTSAHEKGDFWLAQESWRDAEGVALPPSLRKR